MSVAEQLRMRAIAVEKPGTYIHVEELLHLVRLYAAELEDPAEAIGVLGFAMWLSGGEQETEEVPEPQAVADPAVYRVELYPIEEQPGKMRWYARTVDVEGNILREILDSWDYDYVYKSAHEQYPDAGIQQLNGPMDDSVWLEHQERNAYPTAAPLRERVSPKRMFGR